MRKLLLIQPPTLAEAHSGLYSLAALASYVENDCEVRVLDPVHESLEKTLREFTPDIIGITSYTITYPEAAAIMMTARMLAPHALRIIGGVHISCLPGSLDEVFDAGVMGDGEETLRDIIRSGTRETISRIPGVCYRESGRVKVNPRGPVDTATLPVPRLHKYAPQSYKNGVAAFITSRGCPFRCAFCYSPVMREGVRNYPVPWVADQFEYALNTLKANYLMLLDDTVCSDIGRLHAIAEELEKRHLDGFNVAVNIRSSVVTEELCLALRRLHVVSWNCGFESGSDRILKQVKGSSASVEKHRDMVRLAHKFGFTLNGSFMFGMPEETVEDMEKTLRFMEFLIHEKREGRYKGGFWFFCATPFPGTPWWDMVRAKGAVSANMDWSKLDIKSWEHHLMLDNTVSPEQWEDIRRRAQRIAEKANSIY